MATYTGRVFFAPSGADWRRFGIDSLHVLALSSFAVGQPLFDLLGRNPTFFAAHQSTAGDIVTYVIVILIGVPLAIVLVELFFFVISPRAQAFVHIAVVGVLGALVVWPPLTRWLEIPPVFAYVLLVVVGVLLAYAYRRSRGFRRVLSWAGLAPLVFAGWFLVATPVKGLLISQPVVTNGEDVAIQPPIVVVVLDELALGGLLTPEGTLNRDRYPNFGRLADLTTWYPNATTTHDQTRVAVTSILTGVLPAEDSIPVPSAFPRSLFTMLGPEYEFEVQEAITHLCPTERCQPSPEEEAVRLSSMLVDTAIVYGHATLPSEDARRWLPEIETRWAGFVDPVEGTSITLDQIRESTRDTLQARQEHLRWEEFLGSLHPSDTPTLFYLHSLLPHAAWRYLPDGRIYENDFFGDLFEDGAGAVWRDDPVYTDQGLQRFLLQLGYVDYQIGRMIDKLEEEDILDDSLLVVLADHGISFRPGEPRRNLSEGANPGDIMPVPLFLKLPGQDEGAIDLASVQTADVLPTIAAVLGTAQDWDFDGASLLGDSRPSPRVVTESGVETMSLDSIGAATEFARSAAERFGDGSEEYDIYGLGPHRGLLGVALNTVPQSTVTPDISVAVSNLEAFKDVDPNAGVIPARVTGAFREEPVSTRLALALNGRIAAVGEAYLNSDGDWRFSMFVPTDLLQSGCNEAALYLVNDLGQLSEIRLEQAVGC